MLCCCWLGRRPCMRIITALRHGMWAMQAAAASGHLHFIELLLLKQRLSIQLLLQLRRLLLLPLARGAGTAAGGGGAVAPAAGAPTALVAAALCTGERDK